MAAGVELNLLYYIKAISKTRWLNFAIGPAVVLMVMHGFSLTRCQGTHISMPFRTCILAWNNTYCIISRWTSSGNTPQLSWKAFCICQPSTSHDYLAVGTQRVMGSRLMDTQAFWFLIVIVILSTWGLGNASFEPPSLSTHTPPPPPSTPLSPPPPLPPPAVEMWSIQRLPTSRQRVALKGVIPLKCKSQFLKTNYAQR